MDKEETHIQAQEIIMQGLTAAIEHGKDKIEDTDISFTPSGIIKHALQEQNAIGWTNFYKGRIT
jgi:hypothetical protein